MRVNSTDHPQSLWSVILMLLTWDVMSQARWRCYHSSRARPQGGGGLPSSGQDHEQIHSWQGAQGLQSHSQPAKLGGDPVSDRPREMEPSRCVPSHTPVHF